MRPAEGAAAAAATLDRLSLDSPAKGGEGGASRAPTSTGLAPATPASAGRPPRPPRSHGSAASIEDDARVDTGPAVPLPALRIAPPALADAHEPLLDPSEDRYTMYPIK